MSRRQGAIGARKRRQRIALVLGLAGAAALVFALQIAPYLLSLGR